MNKQENQIVQSRERAEVGLLSGRLLRDPWSWFLLAICLLMLLLSMLGLLARWIGFASPLVLTVLLLIVFLLRRQHYAREQAVAAAAELSRERQLRLGTIRADLYDLASDKRVDRAVADLAASSLAGFEEARERFDHFIDLLDRKLNHGELAHVRYRQSGEQFMAAVSACLGRAADGLLLASGDERADCAVVLERVDLANRDVKAALTSLRQAATELSELPDVVDNNSADAADISSQLETISAQIRRLQELSSTSTSETAEERSN